MKEPFILTSQKIGVQIGRTVIYMSMKPNENLGRNYSINETNVQEEKIIPNKGLVKSISLENCEKKNEKSGKNKLNGKGEFYKSQPKDKELEEDYLLDGSGKSQKGNIEEELNNREDDDN